MAERKDLQFGRRPEVVSDPTGRFGYEAPLPPPLEPDARSPIDYWRLLGRRKLLVATFVIGGSLAGALLTLRQVPEYRARTSLEIQSAEEAAVRSSISGRDLESPSDTALQSYLQTQVVILESKSFRKRVTNKLLKDKPHAFYTMDSITGWRQVFGLETEEPPERRVETGIPPVNIEVRVVPNTRIIEIAVDSPDPAFSADYANGMANEFLGYNLEARWDASKRTTEWLTGQLESFKSALKDSEDRLQAYRASSGLTSDNQDRSLEQEKLRQVQEELSRAEADRVALQIMFDLTKSTPTDALPQVADNARLSQYQSRLGDLRRSKAELLLDFTPNHPDVTRVETQIQQMEATVEAEKHNVLARIENEFKAAAKREQALAAVYQAQLGTVSTQAGKMVNYSLLRREVDTNRSLYDTLLNKMKEAGIAAAASSSDSRIVDPATPPQQPYKPNIYMNTVGGFLLGFLCSVGVVLVKEQLDATYKGPGETAAHLHLPELGVIPASVPAFSMRALLPVKARPKAESTTVELTSWREAPSLMAESFRSAMASILMSTRNRDIGRLLLVTSACRDDGKTTTVANLGIALAEIGQRVLLIDADMRMPRLHSVFNVPASPGLSDVLCDAAEIAEAPLSNFWNETQVQGLHVMSAGSRTVSISRLLYSRRVGQLLRRLQAQFDVILIDTPPLLSMSDARVLGHLAEDTILVVRAGKTPRDLAFAAKQRLLEDGISLLGTILVAWDGKSRTRYGLDSYYSSYYAAADDRQS